MSGAQSLGYRNYIGTLGLLGLLSVISGIILQVNPYPATIALPFVLGIVGIIFGFAPIVGAFMVRSAQKAT